MVLQPLNQSQHVGSESLLQILPLELVEFSHLGVILRADGEVADASGLHEFDEEGELANAMDKRLLNRDEGRKGWGLGGGRPSLGPCPSRSSAWPPSSLDRTSSARSEGRPWPLWLQAR